MAGDVHRPRPRTAALLGWSMAALLVACLLTLWASLSLVTYDLGDRAGTYFRISFLGVAAIGLCVAAARQFFRSPGEGSREQRLGTRLLAAGAAATVAGVIWLLLV